MQESLALLLRQTLESYYNVHPDTGTKMEGWEKWFAHWMLSISDIRDVLGVEPTATTLEKLLLRADALYARAPATQTWPQFVAEEMIKVVSRYTSQKK